MDALVEALQKATSLTEIVSLLSELSSHEGEITLHQRDYILVPDQDSTLRTLSNVYFNDMGDRSVYITLKDELFPVHSAISRLVSQGLGIPFLSSLQLDDDDNLDIDDDDMDMSESLVARIKTVLVEYDIQYSFNEFLANAADAGACQFGVVLDTSRHRSDHILCPEMEIFQHRPAMVLFNDATFSLDDFRGLRNVGEGGKQSINGTIGKFGLGALSYYQFTEVSIFHPRPHSDSENSYLRLRSSYPENIYSSLILKECIYPSVEAVCGAHCGESSRIFVGLSEIRFSCYCSH